MSKRPHSACRDEFQAAVVQALRLSKQLPDAVGAGDDSDAEELLRSAVDCIERRARARRRRRSPEADQQADQQVAHLQYQLFAASANAALHAANYQQCLAALGVATEETSRLDTRVRALDQLVRQRDMLLAKAHNDQAEAHKGEEEARAAERAALDACAALAARVAELENRLLVERDTHDRALRARGL